MEMIMSEPTTVYTTYHCNYSTGGANGQGTTISNFNTSAFHLFGLQWYPKTLIWYVDGVQVFNFSSACVPNKPVYILANLAVGGSWPGSPTSATVFPSYLEIDYIRYVF
jgi:serralysin